MDRVQCLFFDCFGTVTDWRSTVTRELSSAAAAALKASGDSLPGHVRARVHAMTDGDWGAFAAEWRGTYYQYVRSVASDPSVVVKTIDQHHLDSLHDLLAKHQLSDLWNGGETARLSLIWHRLDGWPDSSSGIRELNKKFQTSTLSNGNVALLTDMAKNADLAWTHVVSADMFNTFKPNPRVYTGAAERLGFQPEQCAMVAAHLGDLKAAHGTGFRTIYIERPQEESFSAHEVANEKSKGWVDLWVAQDEDGFLEAARRLGIN